jgi:multidrug efflux pump subunit AcrB
VSLAARIDRHRRSLLFVAFALGLAGIAAGLALPVGLFPVVSFPRLRIEVTTASTPAKQMLIEVTQPLEAAARAVPDAINVTSTTSRGSAELFVDFPWGTDMRQALLSVDAAFARALPTLPPGTDYEAIQMSPSILDPFVSYALSSDTVSPAALRRMAQYQIVPLLTAIPGIRRVGVLGGKEPEIEVTVQAEALRAHGLTLADVTNAIAAGNRITAVGRLEDNDRLFLAVDNNAFTSVGSVRNVVLRTGEDGILRLDQIAKVEAGAVPEWLLVVNNGRPAVTIDVFQQDSADSLSLAREVDAKLADFMRTQPRSIHLAKWYDQTQLVGSSIAALEEAILIGLVFAALVILVFLRNWRVTLVAMIVVPLSVLITVLLLLALGLSFNIMTLGGIAAAIGLLIDDVIVMIEHIARRTGVPGAAGERLGVLNAAREFLTPLFGSSLATILIFIPLAFLSGVTGAFFRYLSLTMASALIISFLLTAFVVPLLARGVVDFQRWKDPAHGRETWLRRTHARILDRLFAFPALIAVSVAALIGIGWLAYAKVGTGFLPRMDEGGFVLDYQTAPGTSLAETDRELEEVQAILKSDPDVDTYSRRTGAGFGGDLKESYQGDFVVRLVGSSRRPSIWTVMDEITHKIEGQVPGIHFDIHQLLGDMIGDLVGRREPVVVELRAENPDILPAVARQVAAAIVNVPGIEPASVNDGVVPAGDALEVHVDPGAAALEGMTPEEVEAQLDKHLHGAVVTRYLASVQEVGVRVWLDPSYAALRRDRLGALPIYSPNGRVFPLGTVAGVDFVSGQPQITRANLAQIVAVTAQTNGSADLGSTIAAVRQALARPGLIPPGVSYDLGGAYKQQQIAFRGMLKVLAAAVIAEIVLLLFLYERFWFPVIIIASALISTGAVFIGLWVTGVELNITALMGMVMIIGIATEMAVFLASEYQALAKSMPPRQAAREAALNRLRPIAMSTLAMMLALAPLGAAISGSGDQMLQPLAITIIAGIAVQLPLVLLAMPVVIALALRPSSGGSP